MCILVFDYSYIFPFTQPHTQEVLGRRKHLPYKAAATLDLKHLTWLYRIRYFSLPVRYLIRPYPIPRGRLGPLTGPLEGKVTASDSSP